ncbi:MAG: type II CRISPR RNA-guided endonuclease Cas9 [Bacilli bacterium]|nr:type II CRISPR RNA-guided endonuclease Cas9 [Bacilli bacterium]
MDKRDYTIGLDIGTASVGWAVTYDDNFNLVNRKMKINGNTDKKRVHKNFWGVRLFDSADTAKNTRLKRNARRRLKRRKNRITYLRRIFDQEITKIDPSFFIRLDDSFFQKEDKREQIKAIKYPLFINEEDEKAYYKDYPTIYHLRKALASKETNKFGIDENGKADIRLVYLAMHHIIKYRGHFINEGINYNFENLDIVGLLKELFIKYYDIIKIDDDIENMIDNNKDKINEILKDKTLNATKKNEQLRDLDVFKDNKNINKQIESLFTALLGNKINLKNIFDKENYDEKITDIKDVYYSKDTFEEKLNDLESILDDVEYEIIVLGKQVYDSIILASLVNPEDKNAPLSSQMIKVYDEHKDDLEKFKNFIKDDFGYEVYKEVFKDRDNIDKTNSSYAAYIDGKTKSGQVVKGSQEAFYKYIKKLILNDSKKTDSENNDSENNVTEKQIFKEEISNKSYAQEILTKMDLGTFLAKQRTSKNGSLPYQVHLHELKKIIENQKDFYPFLNDEIDVINRDGNNERVNKIETLLKFRIPYYVGPLIIANKGEEGHKTSDYSKFAWMQKKEGKEDTPITPYNFNEVIDVDESAKEFIERMTSFCTYLPDKKVLPKASLTYQEYCVRNELAVCGYYDSKNKKTYFDKDTRNKIFEDLFKKNKKVTIKMLKDFIKENLDPNLNSKTIIIFGVDTKNNTEFNNSLKTYHDYEKIFSEEKLDALLKTNEGLKMLEDIIKMQTVFTDNKQTKRQIKSKYDDFLDDEIIDELSKIHYKGFGNLSYELLNEITDNQEDTILDWLKDKEYHYNFMQLVEGDNAPFKKIITDYQERLLKNENDNILSYENVENLTGSPAIKKGIWQSILIVKEITKIMGYEPSKIAIEFARENQDSITNKTRKDQIKKLYDKIKDKELKKELNACNEANFSNEKYVLYFRQLGKCAYTLENLDISNLSSYQVDHIIPQSFIKDDSFENKVLVTNNANQQKLNSLPFDIFNDDKIISFWLYLYDCKLIGAKKLKYLKMKTDEFEKESSSFINRQLVETRQISKHVAQILDKAYPNTKIMTIKAGLVSQFREGVVYLNNEEYDGNKFKEEFRKIREKYDDPDEYKKDDHYKELAKQLSDYQQKNPPFIKEKIHDGYAKVRDINDYHHAHDAYILNVIATFLYRFGDYESFGFKDINEFRNMFIYSEYKGNKSNTSASEQKRRFKQILTPMVDDQYIDKDTGEYYSKEKLFNTVDKNLNYHQMNIVKKTEIQSGQFSDETTYKKPKENGEITGNEVNKKNNLPFKNYGGQKAQVSAFSILDNENKLKNITIKDSSNYINQGNILKIKKFQKFINSDMSSWLVASFQEKTKGKQLVLSFKEYKLINEYKNKKDIDIYSEECQMMVNKLVNYIDSNNIIPIVNETPKKKLFDFIDNYKNKELNYDEFKKLIDSLMNLVKFGTTNSSITGQIQYTDKKGLELNDATLIFHSITGLYETRIKVSDIEKAE